MRRKPLSREMEKIWGDDDLMQPWLFQKIDEEQFGGALRVPWNIKEGEAPVLLVLGKARDRDFSGLAGLMGKAIKKARGDRVTIPKSVAEFLVEQFENRGGVFAANKPASEKGKRHYAVRIAILIRRIWRENFHRVNRQGNALRAEDFAADYVGISRASVRKARRG